MTREIERLHLLAQEMEASGCWLLAEKLREIIRRQLLPRAIK